MALKVRCQRCRKKISLDDAFAGGVCRCPYCKTITMVSGRSAVSRTTRPDRPDTPADAVSQVQPVESTEAVTLAKPVLIQGIVALVLLGLVLLLLVVGVMLVLEIRASLKEPSGGTGPVTNRANATNVNGGDNLPTADYRLLIRRRCL